MLRRGFSLYTKLGRWKIEHDIKINIKIDQANKDNSDTYNFEEKVKEPKNKEWKDEFLVPYCM